MNENIIGKLIDLEIEANYVDLSFYDAPKNDEHDKRMSVYAAIYPQNDPDYSEIERFITGIFRDRLSAMADIYDALKEAIEIARDAERHEIFMRYNTK